jgi:dienelactone hydrolase
MLRLVAQRAWLPFAFLTPLLAQEPASAILPGTRPMDLHGDISQQMVAGIDRFAMRQIDRSIAARATLWNRDLSSPESFERSVRLNREHLRRMIGAVDERVPIRQLEFIDTTLGPSVVAHSESYTVSIVRWPVFENVHGEGLLLQPKGKMRARIIALPDADQTPEMLAGCAPGQPPVSDYARRLAENGAQVLIPVLIDRRDEWSGNARFNRFTNQPHREWIYRQAYEMGRHIIGYEVQKVLAAVDWMTRENQLGLNLPIGAAGYAEGGLIAFYAAALDVRIKATWISGYFDSRQKVWAEPIYRNVFGLLQEFGDAEIASLIAPRALVIEPGTAPAIDGPPAPRRGRSNSAAPGAIVTANQRSVEQEFARAKSLCGPSVASALQLCTAPAQAIEAFWSALAGSGGRLAAPGKPPVTLRKDFHTDDRQQRQVRELEAHTQKLMRLSEEVRQEFFWQKLKRGSPEDWRVATSQLRTTLWNEVFGRLPAADLPLNARSRKFDERRHWTGYELVLDVWEDVFAWGYLLLPKNMRSGERRPVVVCQHGLEGLPGDTVTDDASNRAFGFYKGFAAQLADRGFVVFAPHNPYRGRDEFRVLQRKLNPLKQTLYSVIAAQHGRILEWLAAQPFVDSARIGFYGLSYGGKTAMRIPALFDRYALSICSGDFNEWIRKNVSVDLRQSYVFSPEYEMPEFNLGNTFNYAEMAALIAPRPFMVERGHSDGVGTDEWVSYEYAKVRRLYSELGIPDRTAIEYFDGPHTINGVGTFDFLHRHLNWPKPPGQAPPRTTGPPRPPKK